MSPRGGHGGWKARRGKKGEGVVKRGEGKERKTAAATTIAIIITKRKMTKRSPWTSSQRSIAQPGGHQNGVTSEYIEYIYARRSQYG